MAIELAEVRERMGGEAAYRKAKKEGKTNLTFTQWLTVRTPSFKKWFGEWDSASASIDDYFLDPNTGEPRLFYRIINKNFHGDVPLDIIQEQKFFADVFYGDVKVEDLLALEISDPFRSAGPVYYPNKEAALREAKKVYGKDGDVQTLWIHPPHFGPSKVVSTDEKEAEKAFFDNIGLGTYTLIFDSHTRMRPNAILKAMEDNKEGNSFEDLIDIALKDAGPEFNSRVLRDYLLDKLDKNDPVGSFKEMVDKYQDPTEDAFRIEVNRELFEREQKFLKDVLNSVVTVDPSEKLSLISRSLALAVSTKFVYSFTGNGNYLVIYKGTPRERLLTHNNHPPFIIAKSATENLGGFVDDQRSIRFQIMPPKEVDEKLVEGNIVTELPEGLRVHAKSMVTTLKDLAKRGQYALSFTHDLKDFAKDFLPSVSDYVDASEKQGATRRHLELQAERISSSWMALDDKEQLAISSLLLDSKRAQKWFVQPLWRGEGKNFEVDPALNKRWEALSEDAKAVLITILKYEDSMWVRKLNAMLGELEEEAARNRQQLNESLKDEPEKLAEELKKIDKFVATRREEIISMFPQRRAGPYIPERRFGNFVVVAMGPKFLKLRKEGKTVPDAILSDPNEYQVQFAPTLGQAERIADELRKKGVFEHVEASQREEWHKNISNVPFQFVKRMSEMLEASREGGDTTVLNRARTALFEAYILTLQDSAAQKSKLALRNIAGVQPEDLLDSFLAQARADANFIASLEWGSKAWDALFRMRKEALAPSFKHKVPRQERIRIFNELAKRQALSMWQESTIANSLMSLSSLYMLLSSPAFYFQNFSQPFMMSVPLMAGKFGNAKSWDRVVEVYKEIKEVVFPLKDWPPDFSKKPNKVGREMDMLQSLLDKGRIDIGIDTELGTLLDNAAIPKKGRVLFSKLSGLARRQEVVNRVVTALAAYRLEYEAQVGKVGEEKAHERATAYADEVVTRTQGDYSRFNSPVLFYMNGPARLITQFRKFQLIQISLLAKMWRDMRNELDPEQRAVGRRALISLITHMAVFTGARGLPLWSIIGFLLPALLGDDDEPKGEAGLELMVRRMIGDPTLSRLVLGGFPAMAGIDLSKKIGMGQMFSLLPFAEVNLSTREGYATAALAAAGPLVGGLGPRFVDGMNLIRTGNYWLGLEQLLPRGIRDVMGGIRYANEGLTTRRGEQILPEEEVGFFTGIAKALGLTPTNITELQLKRHIFFELEQTFRGKSSELRTRYLRESRQGNREELRRIEERWQELQEVRARYGFAKQPLSRLKSVLKEARKHERMTMGGIQYTSRTKRAAINMNDLF